MPSCRPIRDRRGGDRPANGDRKVCPRCGGQSLEFNERYRIPGADGVVASTPAWVCERAGCGWSLPVRGHGRHNPDIAVRPTMARSTLRRSSRKKIS